MVPHKLGYPNGVGGAVKDRWLVTASDSTMVVQTLDGLLDPASPPVRIPVSNPAANRRGMKPEIVQFARIGGDSLVTDGRDGYLYLSSGMRIDPARQVAQRLGPYDSTASLGMSYSGFYGLCVRSNAGLYRRPNR